MNVKNLTPFATAWLVTLDKDALEHLVVVVKGTYAIGLDGSLNLTAKQIAPQAADEFHGEPGKSSIRYAAELGPPKPATDVALIGSAVAPRGDTRMMDVSLRVGPMFQEARVYGERRWKRGLLGQSATGPEAFDRIPLIYEKACGGSDESPPDQSQRGCEPGNPVGRGYRAKGSQKDASGEELPNIEDPRRTLQRPGPTVPPAIGFGFIGRDWAPRKAFAGTYDEAWLKGRMPLLPLDFDDRFHNAAHPALVAKGYLQGNEPVEIVGCSATGPIRFSLPGSKPAVDVRFTDGPAEISLNLETVLIETDAMRLGLVWKGAMAAHKRVPKLSSIVFRQS